MARYFLNQARDQANNAYVSWRSLCSPDTAGLTAPQAILPGSVSVVASWDDLTTTYYIMQARNAAGDAYIRWTVTGSPDTLGNQAPGGSSAIAPGSAVILSRYTGGNAPVTPVDTPQTPVGVNSNIIIYPLTFDEEDADGRNHLTRLGSGPHISPDGFRGNSVDSRYVLTTLPSWQSLASDNLSLTAIIKSGPIKDSVGNIDTLVSVTHASTDTPKMQICVLNDIATSGQAQLAVRVHASTIQTLRMNRAQWRYEFRFPELLNGSVPAAQSVCFQNATTLYMACHQNDQITGFYRVDLTTGLYTGRALSTEYIHLNSMKFNRAGLLWANCFVVSLGHNMMIQIDIERSFICGELHVNASWDTSPLTPSIGFITVDGIEYAICQEFGTVNPAYIYVFLASQMSGPVNASNRLARYDLGLRIQDTAICPADGLLYVSRNVAQGGSTLDGYIQSYDLAALIAGAPGNDGAVGVPVATYFHAGKFAEGLDFHPGTGRLWSCTEGLDGVGDEAGWSALWSTSIPQVNEEQQYNVDYNGSTNLLEVRVNQRLMFSKTLAVTGVPQRLCIGATPNATAGLYNTASTGVVIRSLAMKDRPFTGDELSQLRDGTYEPHTLTAFSIGLANPGAEDGDTSGWTEELSGTMTVRSAAPVPFQGSFYFQAGGGTNNRARQRFSLESITGYSADQVDEQTALAEMWGHVEWAQASGDGTTDPGGCGFRTLDSVDAQLVLGNSTEVTISPAVTWKSRIHSLDFLGGTRGVDVLQHRTVTQGTNVDCYIDVVDATVYAKQLDTGTTVVSSITSLNDTSTTNYDMSVVGSNPLSVKGPMGTDFSRAFGNGRGYTGPANTGPVSTFIGNAYTWEGMIYVGAYNPAQGIMWLMGGSGETEAANVIFQMQIGAAGNLVLFWEHDAGVNVTISTSYVVPIGRHFHLGVTGVVNGANRDMTIYENGVQVATGSDTKATGGTSHTVSCGHSGSGSNSFWGKMSYVRISNVARSSSSFAAASLDPAANIVDDANTTGLYLMQERS